MLSFARRNFKTFAAALAITALSCSGAMAQSHFEKRMTEINAALQALPPATTATVLLVGDSITEQFSTTDSLPKEIHGLTVVNQGIGGDQIGTSTSKVGVMARLEQVKQAKPAIVFVMIGINCLWDKDGTADQALHEYEAMVPALKAAVPNAKIVLQSILPTAGDRVYTIPKSNRINTRIEQLAKEHGLTWLDLRPLMQNEKGELKAEYTGDNVHLKKEAYAVWLEKIKETTDALLK